MSDINTVHKKTVVNMIDDAIPMQDVILNVAISTKDTGMTSLHIFSIFITKPFGIRNPELH